MHSPEFVQLITTHQSRLYAYILTLVFDPNDADDVLQETNTVLWSKADQFELGTNFAAWMMRVAYFQVQAYRQRRGREKLMFDDNLIGNIASAAAAGDEGFQQRHRLLRRCMEKLSPRHRDLVRRRYSTGASVTGIAEQVGWTAAAVKQALFRCRLALIDCVHKALASEEQG